MTSDQTPASWRSGLARFGRRIVRPIPPHRRRLALGVLAAVLVLGMGGCVWLTWPAWQVSSSFDEETSPPEPSRLYAGGLLVERGGPLDMEAAVELLEAAGYDRVASGVPAGGRFRSDGGVLEAGLRAFPTPSGRFPGGHLRVTVRSGVVRELTLDGRPTGTVPLEPPLLAAYYGPYRLERRAVRLDGLPEHVVQAVLAAEDDGFFRHTGLSISGILRALVVNLRGGEIRQGGSTLTQQLVKNLYLTHERTLARKLREAVLAIIVEVRYSKREILQAYLNEVYLGAQDRTNLMGLGAAARAYFGKDADDLDLAEAATLAGMINSPANSSPLEHPERALERRDWVLGRIAELEWAEPAAIERALASPLTVAPEPVAPHRAPYFAARAHAEAAERFGAATLEDAGLALLSTIRWSDQAAARETVEWGIGVLEEGWERGAERSGPLQAALISVEPGSGAVLAYVGGRDWRTSQFDRVAEARRQAGSSFKPVVYATALERGDVTPATLLRDEPLTLSQGGQVWQPQNDDSDYLGQIPARTALARSRNVATARLALETGLDPVIAMARRLGITTPMDPFPALALGAFEVTPAEMATVYATFAAGGRRAPQHGLVAVLDADGRPLAGAPLAAPVQAVSPALAYVLTSMLQDVVDEGTATAVRRMGLFDTLAGKTGTSNERRDSWFCGYAPGRATVVWVGYDANDPTRLSGPRAGVPLWARFMTAVRPNGGFASFERPPGVTSAVIDPMTGELATPYCPQVRNEVFLAEHVPEDSCHLHRSWFSPPRDERDPDRPKRLKRWWDKIFG